MISPDAYIDRYFPVLDHGFVALVDYMGGDRAVEQAARVSYGKGTRSVSKTRGLIRYLLRHRHTSPFEQVELKFHIAMPIFVARQLVRHRTQSLNEYSGRYSIMPEAFYRPREWRMQSEKNNQGSSNYVLAARESGFTCSTQQILQGDMWEVYKERLGIGVARELARIDLPLSMYTEWYTSIDLHNLFHLLALRLDPHAQWEIRQFAHIMAGLTRAVAPLSFEAFLDYSLNSYRLSNAEIEALRGFFCLDYSSIQDENLADVGMSKRERQELLDLLQGERTPSTVEDFLLDPNEALSPNQARIRLHGKEE